MTEDHEIIVAKILQFAEDIEAGRLTTLATTNKSQPAGPRRQEVCH